VGGNLSRLLPLIAVLGIFGILAPTPGRATELPCSERVLTDWADNGRLDRPYELQCYEEAIARALQSAARGEHAPVRQAVVSPAASSSRMLLLVLAGASVAVLAAGVLGFVVRRDHGAS
jgi:hypothetical protein